MKSYKELVGLELSEVCKKLGYWWRCASSSHNTVVGFYTFERVPFGHLELRTDRNNIVTHEHHSKLSERYLKK